MYVEGEEAAAAAARSGLMNRKEGSTYDTTRKLTSLKLVICSMY